MRSNLSQEPSDSQQCWVFTLWTCTSHLQAFKTIYLLDQAEQTKYEARIVGLQRAKQEAIAKAEAQSQKATQLQQELDRLTTEKARCANSPSRYDM